MRHVEKTMNIRNLCMPLLLAFLLAGCSAMEVRVDVYKGPLTNDKDVQLEQAVSIAMAAKPLLEQLRHEAECQRLEQLESDGTLDNKVVGFKKRCINERKTKAGADAWEGFYSWRAQHADALLSLYSDRQLRPEHIKLIRLIEELSKDSSVDMANALKWSERKVTEFRTEFDSSVNAGDNDQCPGKSTQLALTPAADRADQAWALTAKLLNEPGALSLNTQNWTSALLNTLVFLTDKRRLKYLKGLDAGNRPATPLLYEKLEPDTEPSSLLSDVWRDPGKLPTLLAELTVAQGWLSEKCGKGWGLSIAALTNRAQIEQRSKNLAALKTSLSTHAPSSALGGGRPDKGMETIVSNYLSKSVKSDNAGEETTELLRHLVHFSEKLRVLGNTDFLFSENQSTPFDSTSNGSQNQSINRYASVLQTMGNSINTLVDDWIKTNKHEHSGKSELLELQKEARNQAWKVAVESGLASVERELGAPAAGATNELALKNALLTGKNGIEGALNTAKAVETERMTLATNARNALDSAKKLVNSLSDKELWTKVSSSMDAEQVKKQIGVIPGLNGLVDAASCPDNNWQACLQEGAKKKAEDAQHTLDQHLKSLTQAQSWVVRIGYLQNGVPSTLSLTDSGKARSVKDVYDLVTNALKHAHVDAVQRLGAESLEARQLIDAIKTNERYRRDHIRIRPAFTYLRNSLPATTLQGNSGEMYPNMLTRSLKSILPMDNNDSVALREQMDKQYWHTVNLIKLSGSGDTLQAVVKDDVGNWYVKGFSTDRTEIMKTLGNAAQFFMKTKLQTAGLKTGTMSATNGGKGSVSGGDLTTYRDYFRERYIKAIRDQSKLMISDGCQLVIDADSPEKDGFSQGKGSGKPKLQDYLDDASCRYGKLPKSDAKDKHQEALRAAANDYKEALLFLADLSGFQLKEILKQSP